MTIKKFNITHFGILLLAGYISLITFLGAELKLPQTGLDESWEQALSEATDTGRTFGKEIVFTYGPLHQVITDQVSSNLKPLIIGRFVFFISFFSIASLVGLRGGIAGICFFCLGIFFLHCWGGWVYGKKDVLVLLLIFWNFIYGSYFYLNKKANKWEELLLGLSVLSCTAASLVKLSFLIFLVPCILCLIFLKNTKAQPLGSIKNIIKIIFSGIFFALFNFALWRSLTNKNLFEFINYFIGPNLEIVKGYSEAMGLSRSIKLTIIQFVISIIILIKLKQNIEKFILDGIKNKKYCFFLFAICFCGFFLFKLSFVRNDGHAILFGQVSLGLLIFLFALSWKEVFKNWIEGKRMLVAEVWILPAILSLCLSILGGWKPSLKTGLLSFFFYPIKTAESLFTNKGRQMLIESKMSRIDKIQKRVEDYKIKSPNTVSADIIPWDITSLKANKLMYVPRPVPQSYSAYSKKLQLMNANFFANTRKSPEVVIVQLKDIDDRHPTSLDGSALRIILQNYKFSHYGSEKSLIYIKNRENKQTEKKILKKGFFSWTKTGSFSYKTQKIKIPLNSNKSWLSMELKKSLSYKMLNIIFRPPSLKIEYFDSKQNSLGKFRLIANATSDILLLSEAIKYLIPDKRLDGIAYFQLSTRSVDHPFPVSSYIIDEDQK